MYKKIRILHYMMCLFLMILIYLIFEIQNLTVFAENNYVNLENMFIAEKNVKSIKTNVELPDYAGSGRGVEVIASGNEATVAYKTAINLDTVTRDTTLITVAVLSSDDYKNSNTLDILLVDKYDENNYLNIRCWQSDGSLQHSYLRAGYSGKLWGRSNEPGRDFYVSPIYGTVAWFQNFNGAITKNSSPFTFRYDKNTKQVITDTLYDKDFVVIDLDDPDQIGEGNVWKGFSTSEVYIKVRISPVFSSDSGFIITKLAGMDLSDGFIKDNKGPEITVNTDKEYLIDMPKALVGSKFKIPDATAYDRIDGKTKVDIFVVNSINPLLNSNFDVKYAKKLEVDGTFIPKTFGNYIIYYYSIDERGNRSVKLLDFNAVETLPPIEASFETNLDDVKMFNNYYIPKINITGGSGKLNVEEVIEFNNNIINMDESRNVFLDNVGIINVKLKVTDYINNVVNITLPIAISVNEPVFIYSGVPTAVKIGETLIVPNFEAYDFNDYTEFDKKIYINDTLLSDNFYLVENGTQLNLKYSASKKGITYDKTFLIDIINPIYIGDYFLTENAQISTNENGTNLIFTGTGRAKLPYPVVADNLILKFKIDSILNDFNYIDISLNDYYNDSINLFFRLTPFNTANSYLQLNGRGTKYIIEGSFNNDSLFYFIINNRKYQLTDKDNKVLCNISTTTDDSTFKGFVSGAVRISFEAEANSTSKICINQISNQVFNSFAYMSGDKTAPNILFETVMRNTSLSINSNLIIPWAKAYDVLSNSSYVTVTVIDPDENYLLRDADCSSTQILKADKFGFYRIIYNYRDSAKVVNKDSMRFTYSVIDETKPVITTSFNINNKIEVGTKVFIPKASVTDDLDVDCTYCIMLYSKNDMKYSFITPESDYTFNKGKYTIIYYSIDKAYNIAKLEFNFDVISK